MNKIFKFKWSHINQNWSVYSELIRANRISLTHISFITLTSLLISPQSIAEECGLKQGKSYDISNRSCEINGTENGGPKKVTSSIGWETYLWARDRGNVTVTGEGLELELIATSQRDNFNSVGINAQNNSNITAKKLSVDLKAKENKHASMQGIVAFGNSKINAETINVDIAYRNDAQSANGSKENYALQIGTAIKGEDSIADGKSKITVNNANINITNIATTNNISAPYQLTGIRIIRNEEKIGSTPVFESTGKITINAYDNSNNSDNHVNGIFVSGPDAKAILNDSHIIIGKSGVHSSALKLGKVRKTGKGAGLIESKGEMILDTATESKASTIHLVGNDSQLIANFDNSSSKITSANTAIVFGANDQGSIGAGENQKALLKNTIISTTSIDSDLIQVNQNTKAEFSLTGTKTDVTAATNAWLINVDSGGEFQVSGSEGKMVGLINKTDTSKLNIKLTDGFKWILREHTDSTKQSSFNTVHLASGATIMATKNGSADFTLKGNISSNDGIITTVDGQTGDILTIDGNYEGNNGLIHIDTAWNSPGDENGANSTSDILKIKGTATGNTTISPIGIGGENNIIEGNIEQITKVVNTIPVIEVDKAGISAFSGKAQTRGAVEVQLAKKTENGKDLYYWTMNAKTSNSTPSTTIYHPTVSAYIQMPRINMEQGYTSLRTLHERRGENKILALDDCGTCGEQLNGQTWGRVFGHRLDLYSKNRFSFDTEIYGFQLGHDFRIKQTDKGDYQSAGFYVAYNQANTKFNDLYRAENASISSDKFTGKGKSKLFSLGLVHNHYTSNGSYLDLVGQISYLKNIYKPRDNNPQTKQHGYGLLLSIEAGSAYNLKKHSNKETSWLIEPQAQLIYQTIKLNKFNDGIRTVKQPREQGIRARIGARLSYNNEAKNYRTNTFYLIANLWSDFSKKRNIKIHQDNITSEKYSRLWGEIGLGIQLPVAKQTYIYADSRYEFQIDKARREGYHGTIGLKYTWK